MSVLSSLAKGYGSWNGDIDLTLAKEATDVFPQTSQSTRPHRHGITVSPRGPSSVPTTASYGIRFQNSDGKLDLPKTFLTRKGALLLFTAPDDTETTKVSNQKFRRKQKGKQMIDLSLKLGTLDRLCKSVLQYGGEEYDRENSSVSDPRNKTFLKFVHQAPEPEDVEFDAHSQPGADLDFYLRDLKSRSSSRQYSQGDSGSVSRSPELREILRDLDGAFPRSMGGRSVTSSDFTESKSGTPKQRVLSSKKLTASLKSSTYLGRPASAVSASASVISEPAVNLPRIASESSIRSRSSTKSGLWVQEEENNQGSAKGSSGRSNSGRTRSSRSHSSRSRSAKSRSSREATPVGDNINVPTTKRPVLPEQEEGMGEATSAADEQEVLLLSDAAEEEAEEAGFRGEADQWPAMEEDGQKGTGSPGADVQAATQPLMPQYKDAEMEEAGSGDEPGQVDMEEDRQKGSGSSGPEVQAVTQPLMPQYKATKLARDADMGIDTAESDVDEEAEVENIPGGPLTDATQAADEVAQITAVTEETHITSSPTHHPPLSPPPSPTDPLPDSLPQDRKADYIPAVDGEAADNVAADNVAAPLGADLNAAISNGISPDEGTLVKVSSESKQGSRPQSAVSIPGSKTDSQSGSNGGSDVEQRRDSEDLKDLNQSENDNANGFQEKMSQIRQDSHQHDEGSRSHDGSEQGTKSRSGSQPGSRSESISGEKVEPTEEVEFQDKDDKSERVIPDHEMQLEGETTQDVPEDEQTMEQEEKMEIEELEDEAVPFTDARDSEVTSGSYTPSIIDVVSDANKYIGDEGLVLPDNGAERDQQPAPDHIHDGDLITDPDLIGDGGDGEGDGDRDVDRDVTPPSPITTQASDDDVEVTTEAAQGEVDEGELLGKGEEASAAGGAGVAEVAEVAGAGPVGMDSPGQMVEGEESQTPASPVKEKSKVTFNEEVTTQIVPETPPETKRQPQPPKAKPSTKSVSKTRTSAKGGNQKDVKVETKKFVKVMDITSVQPETDKQEVAKEEPAAPVKKTRVKKPPAQHVETKSDKTKSSVLPAHMEEVLGRRSTSKSQEELEDEIAQMSVAIEDTLAGPTLVVDAGEGLTAEELTLAQEALLERVKEAESKIDNVSTKTPEKPKVAVKAPGPKSKSKKKNKQDTPEEKRDLQLERAAIKERRMREKQQRLEEAMALQEKIRAREEERRAKEEEARRKAEDLAEEMEDLRREEEAIQQAEEDARLQVAMVRKIEREARDKRRKDEMERKKLEAIRRREKEKEMIQAARVKEAEMLQRIADNEMKRRLEAEEKIKREEEERAAQEKYEDEMRQAQRDAEEEELRMRELEKEAEEEAMQRLVEERENAMRRRWKLKQLARQIEDEERKKREAMLLEEYRLAEEQREKELEEERNREEEKKRFEELQRMEAEARETMRHELERRREFALKRREVNLERRENLDNIRHGQGITRAWVFSYFQEWPRETYNKLMGDDDKIAKMQAFRHKPKPPAEKPPAEKPAEALPLEDIPLEVEEIVDSLAS